jgi:hypothetical protein
MSHIRIDKSKAIKKWSPVLENMGISGERVEWMAEYAEFHSINENAYVNAGIAGMGGVVSAQPSTFPGQTTGNYANGIGSGDVGQNLLPVAMKIAAQTIGLDLVAVKPSPGPKIDLLYVDFQYDDVDTDLQNPQVFKLGHKDEDEQDVLIANITDVVGTGSLTVGGVTKRYYFSFTTAIGGLSVTELPTNDKRGWVEFLGFSRIDGLPMFRAFRQANTTLPYGGLSTIDPEKNSFIDGSMKEQIKKVTSVEFQPSDVMIELVSALEDHIPGFASNWTGNKSAGDYPMSRQQDDQSYAGVIGPKVSTRTIAVGTIEVSSALRRTEIEDIKANTGMDIVQKMESVLVNELSQTISKQIVAKIFEMGELNRKSAPLANGAAGSIPGQTIFDLDSAYATSNGAGLGGETTHAVQRKLITKIAHASNYIATEGRVGPAQYLVTNGGLAATLQDIAGYTINPLKSKMNSAGQLYPVGSIGDIQIYVDPYMKYNDNRVVLGRKNNPDQPGIIFVPYLMAQSISVISEATFAPRMLLRSRYAVAEMGWFPQKQFMTIRVSDEAGLLN